MAIRIRTLDRICLALVIIAALTCGYWVASHGVNKQKQIQEENALISKRLLELKSADTNLEHLKTVLDDTRKELHYLNERIPESARIGEVLKQVHSLAKQRKLVLTSIQPLPIIEERLYTKIPILLVFEGGFVNIYHLLHDLETMNRLMVPESMVISRDSLDQYCRVELTASVFER